LPEQDVARILVVDDHDVVRQGLKALLARTDWEIVGEAADGLAALEVACAVKPDVVIADYSLPNMNGADLTRRIRQSLPDTEVLIFTMHDTEDVVRDTLSAGAIGYLVKSDGSRQLVAAVEALIQHQPYFTAKVNETLLANFLKPGKAGVKSSVLTPRERQVVTLIADGKSCREAAEVLGISAKTAETHRATAMQKLGITTSAALVRYAVRNKLVQA
jgi:DNA-binding NarL/FixJ family response regulator